MQFPQPRSGYEKVELSLCYANAKKKESFSLNKKMSPPSIIQEQKIGDG
jgi:hypothetical protein